MLYNYNSCNIGPLTIVNLKFKNMPKKLKLIMIFLIFINLQSCAYLKKDNQKETQNKSEVEKLKERKRPNPDLRERSEKYEGTLFNSNRLKKNNTNFEFSTSNPLWRATLSSFDGIPLQTVSYSGGVIVTDWWSKEGGSESIKIQVNFQSNEKPNLKFLKLSELDNLIKNYNQFLYIKFRKTEFLNVIYNSLPWEDLVIGFQCRILRKPNIYNSEFWYHFTNIYVNEMNKYSSIKCDSCKIISHNLNNLSS